MSDQDNELAPDGMVCPVCEGTGVEKARWKELGFDGWDDEGYPNCPECDGRGYHLFL